MKEAEPSASFRTNARIRILNSVTIPSAPVPWFRRINMTYHMARWAGGAALASLIVGGTMVYAAQYSTPGSALYPLKTASEQAALKLAPTVGLRTSVATTVIDRRAREVSESEATGSKQTMEQAVTSFQDTVHSLEHTNGLDTHEIETHVKAAEAGMKPSLEEAPHQPTTEPKRDTRSGEDSGEHEGTRANPQPTLEPMSATSGGQTITVPTSGTEAVEGAQTTTESHTKERSGSDIPKAD